MDPPGCAASGSAPLGDVLLQVVGRSLETIPRRVQESDAAPVPVAVPDLLSLRIEATEITWVSVSVDDGGPKEWLLRTGESISVTAREKFTLKIGNAGGTRLTLNNRDIGSLGPRGKIVDIVLTENGEN